MDEEKLKRFMDIIMQLESSRGQNIEHQRVPQGVHAGDTAIGRYGLMPNTINELINRARLSGEVPEYMQQVKGMQSDAIKRHLESNPDIEQQFAQKLAERVLTRQGGDEEKAAYSWFQGHNLTPEKIEQRKYKESPYVQKYLNELNKIKGDQ